MKLENINKENPFKVPDNYFDNFNDIIEKRIKSEKIEIVESHKMHKIHFLNPLFAVAASILLFLLCKPLNISNDTYTQKQYIIESQISEAELLDYITAEYSDYEIYIGLQN